MYSPTDFSRLLNSSVFAVVLLFGLATTGTVQAESIGLVTDSQADVAVLFDTASDRVLTALEFDPGARLTGCSISADERTAFVLSQE